MTLVDLERQKRTVAENFLRSPPETFEMKLDLQYQGKINDSSF